MKRFKYQITVKVLISKYRINGHMDFDHVYPAGYVINYLMLEIIKSEIIAIRQENIEVLHIGVVI